jgi:hypothetical protein
VSKFEALAGVDTGDDDAMVDVTAASSKPKTRTAQVTQDLPVDAHAGVDEDDEIT